jgi:hypothetical protein
MEPPGLRKSLDQVLSSSTFMGIILSFILLNTLVMGLQTMSFYGQNYGTVIDTSLCTCKSHTALPSVMHI